MPFFLSLSLFSNRKNRLFSGPGHIRLRRQGWPGTRRRQLSSLRGHQPARERISRKRSGKSCDMSDRSESEVAGAVSLGLCCILLRSTLAPQPAASPALGPALPPSTYVAQQSFLSQGSYQAFGVHLAQPQHVQRPPICKGGQRRSGDEGVAGHASTNPHKGLRGRPLSVGPFVCPLHSMLVCLRYARSSGLL